MYIYIYIFIYRLFYSALKNSIKSNAGLGQIIVNNNNSNGINNLGRYLK